MAEGDTLVITLDAYFKGRDKAYPEEINDVVLANAQITVERVNDLLARSGHSDLEHVNSGFRPKAVNDSTANAAATSKHLSAQAADLPDPDRSLADWCVDNLDQLEEIGLWIEHPGWTPTWLHVQTVPPKSGKRVFIPNGQPPADPDYTVA